MTLANFWAAAIALTILLYVVLDGFDLGVGILFGFTREGAARRQMLAAISPVWDGNETWLVLAGSALFAAFPMVYALLLSAFYLPLCFMLGALILRGVAFEFRHHAGPRMRIVWDLGFAGGSIVAAFVQGATVGALVYGVKVGAEGRFAGQGALDWLTPFSVLCGAALCLGYVLLGAAWLVLKSEGAIRERCYRLLPRLLAAVLACLACIFAASLWMHLRVMDRWIERPWLAVFPCIGLLGIAALLAGVRRRRDGLPFAGAALLFVVAFAMLAATFLPYMVPFSITIAQGAAPHSSLAFVFWGAGAVVLPLTIIYAVTVYTVFRGKLAPDAGYHDAGAARRNAGGSGEAVNGVFEALKVKR
jgi:cytochrome d ubiquinol oxidase subunit II